MKSRARRRGQSMTETIIVLPLFLTVMFMALQLAELGVALLTVNYAASSIARKAANEKAFVAVSAMTPAAVVKSDYTQKASDLMVAGMQLDDLIGCVKKDDPSVPTAQLQVAVRAKVQAWPFFANLMHGALQSQYDSGTLSCFEGASSFGPFNYSAGAPYYFYVTGRTSVRLNYVPAT